MSSEFYSAKIRPENRCRRLLLGSGVVLGLCATVLIVQMPLPLHWRVASGLAWGALCVVELWLTMRCYRRARRYRLYPDGTVSVRYSNALSGSAWMMPGCIVLQRAAWLRFCNPAGASWGEPITRNGQNPEQWRRLQVICRHRAAC